MASTRLSFRTCFLHIGRILFSIEQRRGRGVVVYVNLYLRRVAFPFTFARLELSAFAGSLLPNLQRLRFHILTQTVLPVQENLHPILEPVANAKGALTFTMAGTLQDTVTIPGTTCNTHQGA